MDLQLRHLAVLVAVVDAGTFTDAAARLGVSQAAVSRSVAGLEAALGVRLLDRTTRQVTPTETGCGWPRRRNTCSTRWRTCAGWSSRRRTELRIGYAWAALGRHTRPLQKRWAREHMQTPLVFVQVNEAAAGLADGSADVSVIRRPVRDARFATAEIGLESRYAAVSTGTALARRRPLRLADLIRYTVAIDARTGTTTLDLWPPDAQPTSVRTTHGVDEWLTLIAAGQAVGVTSEATANQNPRPGVAYRQLVDAPPIRVQLAWWRDNPPRQLGDLLTLARQTYA